MKANITPDDLFFSRFQPFNETVRVCHNPLVRTCNNDTQGPDICNTYYETNCETSYKTYEVEQDEPICKMELMKKCDNVTSNFPMQFSWITAAGGIHKLRWEAKGEKGNNTTYAYMYE